MLVHATNSGWGLERSRGDRCNWVEGRALGLVVWLGNARRHMVQWLLERFGVSWGAGARGALIFSLLFSTHMTYC
jgi:hypothetical protein